MIPDKSLKIAVGLSGGVDSSVAALLLKRAGYDVFALFMQNWHDTTGTLHGDCEWEEDRFIAEMVAKKLDIPFHFVDLSDIYRKRVVDYMFSEYEKGRTPNPDVLCNREVKFAAFLKAALDLGADFVATGHYCRKEKFKDDSGNIIYRILRGRDPGKDQSYFLCQLDQQQLSRALFPIGHLLKSEVRELAREAQLPSAEKKDSQGICFVGKVDLPLFLQQKLEPKEGDVVEIFREHYDSMPVKESLEEMASPLCYTPSQGKVIGSHQGAYYYTIGQRKGLNIGGHKEPLFIISIDIITNTIYVGEGESHPGLYRRALKILPAEVHWIRPDLALESSKELKCDIRIRYRQPLQKGRLICRREALYILFDKPQRGITPGQFAVWYAPDGEMLGSGVIND